MAVSLLFVSLQPIIIRSCMRKLLILSLLATSASAEVQQYVVADMESRAPIRDVLIHTDDNQDTRSNWDGTFSLHEGFGKINLSHLNYEKRYILKSELKGDTIWLMPNMNALREVVIYGERRFDNRMAEMRKSTMDQSVDAQLARIKIPSGPNVLAIASWLFENTLGKNLEKRARRKKALKVVRQQEAEYQQRWDALEGKKE
ncbi:hypothetical protein SAMN04487902_10875 [Prevotella sp. ne3005]|nr:hypothetical protein SAMN04487902_10875 [Prevotella sp. ne3005]